MSTPFAPSVFGGGEADKPGIRFNIPGEIYGHIYDFEQSCLQAIEAYVPNMFEIGRTAVTPCKQVLGVSESKA